MPKKLYIETVGCQMNVLDSELVVGGLRRLGYELTATPADADLILFNTCSVRQHAEDKIYSALGRVRSLKRRHPERVVGVLGCMAQKDQDLVRRRAPHVDIVCGPGQLGQLPELIAEVKRSGRPQMAVSLGRADAPRPEVTHSFESYDPLREPSMRPTPFQASVRTQFGCNDVLKRMKRLYTVEYYRDMLHRCRERVPGVAISSDFIVGFCGETEASFGRTCDLVRDAGFKNSFIFKYSARPGTKADELYPDDVPDEVKKRRNNDLLAIQGESSLADHRRWIGETVEVLVEGPSKHAFAGGEPGRVR